MSNVFVLTPGRTASTTFSKACEHIENYTSAHEMNSTIIDLDNRLTFPNNHIEVDNRLIWYIDNLKIRYGSSAKYVYLRRKPDDVALSYHKRWNNKVSIVRGYGESILMKGFCPANERLSICQSYSKLVDEKLLSFIKDNEGIIVNVENIESDFRKFYDWISAKGDVELCINEFNKYYNKNPKSSPFKNLKTLPKKIVNGTKQFPEWFKRL